MRVFLNARPRVCIRSELCTKTIFRLMRACNHVIRQRPNAYLIKSLTGRIVAGGVRGGGEGGEHDQDGKRHRNHRDWIN